MVASRDAHVLLVDDEADTLRSLADGLHKQGCDCTTAQSGKEALTHLSRGRPVDVVVTDLRMPDMDGLEFTREVRSRWSGIEVIILTAYPTTESALIGGRFGAAHYMTKPVTSLDLGREIRKFVRKSRTMGGDLEKRHSYEDIIREELISKTPGIIGRHPSMQGLKRNIQKIGKISEIVLIQGESGSGKELVARALHDCSPRRAGPFLQVNLGAVSSSMMESELFGHVKGAFSGAIHDREGCCLAAGDGTLFLDEISELPLSLQVKLLHALQKMEIRPLGDDRSSPWSARVVCATNRDIARVVQQGEFRHDLYYRVNVLNIQVPSLRERQSDIPLLVHWFLRKHARGDEPKSMTSEALSALCSLDYPGNVRQLENVMITANALASGPMITLDDLPAECRSTHDSSRGCFATHDQNSRVHILRALQKAGGVQTRAADLLDMDRNRLARMIKRYAITREEWIA